jgi:hypothetical protein
MQDVSPTTAPPIVKWAMCGAGVSSAGGTTNYHAACLSLPCLVFPTAGGAVTVNAACTEVAAASPVAKACYRWEGWSSFGAGFPVPDTSVPLMDVEDGGVSGIPGSLGATNTAGTFSAEITEIAQAPAASGFSLGNTTTNSGTMTSYWATVTAYGQTSASSNGTTSSTSQGSELLRARVAIGPIPTVVLGNCQ